MQKINKTMTTTTAKTYPKNCKNYDNIKMIQIFQHD